MARPERTYSRFNQSAKLCGEAITMDDFDFSAFQVGLIDVHQLRDRLGVKPAGRGFRDIFWNECIKLETPHEHP